MKLYTQILTAKQKQILQNLTFLGKSFYLGGGTALALQLGHRTSLDFDFYSPEKFVASRIIADFKKQLPSASFPKEQPEDTFQTEIFKVSLTAFYYPYKLIGEFALFPPIKLASLEDLAAMKIAAVIQRAKQRDFFDTYYLIEKLGLAKIIKSAYQKFPWYEENNQIILKALTYFDEADADLEIGKIIIFDKNVSWPKVKKRISQEIKKYLATV